MCVAKKYGNLFKDSRELRFMNIEDYIINKKTKSGTRVGMD